MSQEESYVSGEKVGCIGRIVAWRQMVSVNGLIQKFSESECNDFSSQGLRFDNLHIYFFVVIFS